MRPNLLIVSARSLMAGLLLVLAPSLGFGQEAGSVVLRGGLTLSPQVSAALEGDVRVWRSLSLVASARGVQTGWGCIGLVSRSPCLPDGISLGVGARISKSISENGGVFLKAEGGAHEYSGDSWYPQLGASAGFEWALGSRGFLELGAYARRIEAARFSTVQDTYGIIPGKAHHGVVGLTAMLGVKVR